MRYIAVIAFYELLRVGRLKSVMFVLFLLPLLLILILGSALSGFFGEGDVKVKPVQTAVVRDGGGHHDVIDDFLSDEKIKPWVQLTDLNSRDEAVHALREGDVEFAVVIPADFTRNVLQGREAHIELIRGKDRGQNRIAEAVFQGFLNRVNSAQAAVIALGPKAAEQEDLLLNTLRQGSVSTTNSTYVQTGPLDKKGKPYTAVQYYAASMLIMFMLYSGMTAAISLVREREDRTLARLTAMPIPGYCVVAGKLSGNGVLAIVQCAVIIGMSAWLYDVDWGTHPIALAVICLGTIVASMSLSILAALAARTSRSVTTLLQLIIIAMTFLSGGFNPDMGGLLRGLGQFTVNHWAMQGMLRIMLDGEQAVILSHISVLLLIALALSAAAMLIYRKAGFHE